MGPITDRPTDHAKTDTPLPADDTTIHRALSAPRYSPIRGYIIAVLAAVAAILVRALLDPWLGGDQVFVISLLAVMFVAWNVGLKPALLALFVSMLGFVFF